MIKILVVDDELQLLELTKAFLESLKEIDAETSLSAKDALERMQTTRYDAIVSDYQMPDMSGIELLKKIRSGGDSVPFILFTGKGREEVVIEALNAGADFYLQKGGDPRAQFMELVHMIERAVQKCRMELDLLQSEHKFKSIFNSANDATGFRELFNNIDSGIAVYHATDGGESFVIKDFNAKAESIENVRKEDVIGKRIEVAFPGAAAMGMIDVLRSVWKTGERAHLGKALYNDAVNGSSWRENLVFRMPNGDVVAVYGDITERKLMEDELRMRKSVFEESIAAMGMADEKGILVQVNDAFLGYLGHSSKAEVLGRSISDFMSDQLEMQVIMKQLELAGRWQGEYHAKRKDGSNIVVYGIATVLRDEGGKVIGSHMTAIDITDQKSGQEISSSTSVKLNILSNITVHDIQNQVVVLNGLVYKAKHANSPVQVKEYLSRIQQVADKIQSHVAFARDYQNLGKAPPSWIRLDTGIMDLTTKFDSKWVQFEANLGSLEVYSDAMLNRAFYNLIDDTLKHGQKATRIKFSAKPQGEDLVLIYEDNGVGVPMERKRSIFEKASSSQKVHGLVLVREILGITGMTIVENGEPGKGARFEILIPKGNFRYPGNDRPQVA